MTNGTTIGEINNAITVRLNGISERLRPTAAIVPSAVAKRVAGMPMMKLFLMERTHCALFHMSTHQPISASGATMPLRTKRQGRLLARLGVRGKHPFSVDLESRNRLLPFFRQ